MPIKKLVIYSRDADVYVNLSQKHPELISVKACAKTSQITSKLTNGVQLLYAGKEPSKHALSEADIVLGEPDLIAKDISHYPNISWVQSTWAGNNKLQDIPYHDYILTGCKGIFGQKMLEYVLAYLLYFERKIAQFNLLKAEKTWTQLPNGSLKSKTLGIMGLGNIAQAIIPPLQMMGLNIVGLATSHKNLFNVEQYDPTCLLEFAKQCDYVFNLLPETAQTKNLCNGAFFEALPSHCIFINAGRGSIIDSPNTLIDALNNKKIGAAVIDVFPQEPLPANHPYYDCDNLVITCHTAAVSDPKQVFDVFIDNLQRYLSHRALLYTHDFSKGY